MCARARAQSVLCRVLSSIFYPKWAVWARRVASQKPSKVIGVASRVRRLSRTTVFVVSKVGTHTMRQRWPLSPTTSFVRNEGWFPAKYLQLWCQQGSATRAPPLSGRGYTSLLS